MNKEIKKLMAINKMLGKFEGGATICLVVGIDEIACGGVCRTCKWNSANYKGEDNE